jgi:hypothetical protein
VADASAVWTPSGNSGDGMKEAPGERHGESLTMAGSPYEIPHGVAGVNGPSNGDVGEVVSVGDTICPAPPYVGTWSDEAAPDHMFGMKLGMPCEET